jgi:tetratricopeptide (TPR) repeat protein
VNEPRPVPEELTWQGYGNYALFQDIDAKIAQHSAQLADLPEDDHTLAARAGHAYALAGLYWASHAYDRSLVCFEQALGLAERLEDRQLQSWCCNGLGDLRAAMGESEGAIAAYRRAIALDPTSAYAYTRMRSSPTNAHLSKGQGSMPTWSRSSTTAWGQRMRRWATRKQRSPPINAPSRPIPAS